MTGKKTTKWLAVLAVLTAALLMLSACARPAEPEVPADPASTEESAEENVFEGEEASDEPAGPATVTAVWADDAEIGDHLDFEADTDSDTKVVFSTDTKVTDFALLSVVLESISDDGIAEFSYETVYLQEKLEPGLPLVVNMTFYGDLPNYGIGYTDTDGTVRHFTVSISGEDGSLILTEF